MKITLNIEKRFAYVIIGVLIIVLGGLIVYSYGGTQPAIVGHSWGEIVCDNNMCVDTVNDRVGIGLTNPQFKLDIDLGNILVQGTGSYDTAGERAYLYLGDQNAYISSEFGAGLKLGAWQVPDAVVIQETTGNVGIGTATPTQKLDVNGNVKANDYYIAKTGKWASALAGGGISCNWNGWTLHNSWRGDSNNNGCVDDSECSASYNFHHYEPCEEGIGLYCSGGQITNTVFCYQKCCDIEDSSGYYVDTYGY